MLIKFGIPFPLHGAQLRPRSEKTGGVRPYCSSERIAKDLFSLILSLSRSFALPSLVPLTAYVQRTTYVLRTF